MNDSFRKSMTWLHTWAGLVFCWILYFMFITGTVGYFDSEIDRWMQPEISREHNFDLAENLRVAQDYLQKEQPNAQNWGIGPVSARERPHLFVNWLEAKPEGEDEQAERGHKKLWVDSGEEINEDLRATGGGQVLYRMHYLLHYVNRDIGYRFVGIVTLLMFIGLITGIVIHRKIFADFFTFRFNKKPKAWLDMHNLLSVSSLPFQLMITYSGLIFVITQWLPLIALGSFGFDTKVTQEELSKILSRPQVEAAGEPATMVDISSLAETIQQKAEGGNVRFIQVQAPNDSNAQIVVTTSQGLDTRGGKQLMFSGVTGELLSDEAPIKSNSAVSVALTMINLHEGLFAGWYLRWLYFFAGLVGAAMVATGAIYYVEKRRVKLTAEKPGRGFRFVEAANIGTIVGLPVAICAYLLANRLLPLGMENRAQWEVHCMFIVLLLCLLHPIFREKQRAWVEQCWLAVAAFIAVPVINAITTEQHLGNTIAQGNWAIAGVDLVCIFMAVVSAVAAKMIAKKLRGKAKQTVAETVSSQPGEAL